MVSFGGARLFGKMPIKEKNTFHVTIHNFLNKFAIGVVDSQYKQNLISGEEPNVIYFKSDRKFWNGEKELEEQGQEGFKAG